MPGRRQVGSGPVRQTLDQPLIVVLGAVVDTVGDGVQRGEGLVDLAMNHLDIEPVGSGRVVPHLLAFDCHHSSIRLCSHRSMLVERYDRTRRMSSELELDCRISNEACDLSRQTHHHRDNNLKPYPEFDENTYNAGSPALEAG